MTDHPQRPSADLAPGERRRRARIWYLLLLIPFVGLLFPGWYAREDPALFGFPFFYWYQFMWVVLTSLLTAVVYERTRDLPRRARREGEAPPSDGSPR